jgi:hypothetical protein
VKGKTILYLILAPIGVLILLCTVGISYSHLHRYLHRDDWKAKTTPLPKETVDILCKNFELEKDHSLCSGKKDVYGPDFIDIIRDDFRPYEAYETKSSEAATYDEVEEKIGIFKYECESVVTEGDGFTYFICDYDLRGDEEFPIGIIFTYPEMATFRIMLSMGYDGE